MIADDVHSFAVTAKVIFHFAMTAGDVNGFSAIVGTDDDVSVATEDIYDFIVTAENFL